MKATIISESATGRFFTKVIAAADEMDLAIAVTIYMKASGFTLTGFADRPSLRAELQGAPKFKGVNGPMWNGDGWRYETGIRRLHDE
jgi:hypothetical protein